MKLSAAGELALLRELERRGLATGQDAEGAILGGERVATLDVLAEGITGWVHNRPDGSVEAVLEGERDAVERLVAFLREGPRGARVDWVDVASEEPQGLSGFETR